MQNEQVQARAGISAGSGSQVREKEMFPQWHLPWINMRGYCGRRYARFGRSADAAFSADCIAVPATDDLLTISFPIGAFIKGLGRCLPVCPVERPYFNGRQIDAIDAADVKGPSAWVEARAGERVNAAVVAKIVLCGFRVELIKTEIGFACEDAKTRI
jgi:hypothetical protein